MKYLLLISVLIASASLYGQERLLRGLVLDAKTEEPVPGATIRVPTSGEETASDRGGRFILNITGPADSILVSSAGYASQMYPVSSPTVVRLEPSINTLDEVVVSADRGQQSIKDVPLAISKINALTIQDTRATGLYQLLNKVSGVYMVNLGNEQHTMAIRQPISYNALYLYLEDGIPIRPTGIFNHNALYEINMNGIRDIEVIKGPASSLYGSNSIGGAINFSTPIPPAGTSQKISAQGDGYNYFRADAGAGFSSEKFGVYFSGYAASQKNSWQEYTDFGKYSGSIKTTYQILPGTKLTVLGTYNRLNTQTPGSLDSARFYSRNYGSNQRFSYRKVNAFRASSRIDHYWNSSNSSFLSIFYRKNSTAQLPNYYIQDIRNQSGQYLKSAGQENEQSFNSYGFLFQHRTSFNFLNSQLIAGAYLDDSPSAFRAKYLDITKDQSRNYYTSYTATDSLIDDYKLHLFNTAAYLQFEMNPTERLRIVAGLRYDKVTYNFTNRLPANRSKYKQQEQNEFKVLAPKIGATYNFSDNAGLYSNLSIGFQPPETSTLYSSRQVAELDQATFVNYELGGRFSFFDKNLFVELTGYAMNGKNEIISVLMPDNTTQNQNAGETSHIGVEYNLIYSPSRQWTFRFSGTNAKHSYVRYSEIRSNRTVIYDGHRMPNAPRSITNSELSWKPRFLPGFRSSFEWQHISKYFVNSANTKTYEGYDIFNIRFGYKPAVAKGAEIWLNVLNATDQLYATTVTGNQYGVTYNAAAPRTFALGISYAFSKFNGN